MGKNLIHEGFFMVEIVYEKKMAKLLKRVDEIAQASLESTQF